MTEVSPWDLRWQGNILYPVDAELHERAVKFCKEHLALPLDPRTFAKLWVAHRKGEVLGVTGIRQTWDIAGFRSIDKPASYALASRLNSYFADIGLRGQDVLLFLSESETPEQRCPNRDAVLAAWSGRPAERFLVGCR